MWNQGADAALDAVPMDFTDLGVSRRCMSILGAVQTADTGSGPPPRLHTTRARTCIWVVVVVVSCKLRAIEP
jgi:hypothetical protein